MDIEVYNSDDVPNRRTFGEWTVLWWNWALSIPRQINPVSDDSGRYSHIRQPNEVWLLAGRFGSEDRRFPHRKCTIPYGRSILFPVLNCEANRLEYPHLQSDQDLINHVTEDVNTVVKKECSANGEPLTATRVPSDPRIFSLNICEENAMNVKPSGLTRAAADGYWIFMKPPPRGNYRLEFEGSCEAGRLSAGATYDLTIL